jgi:plastocyanin
MRSAPHPPADPLFPTRRLAIVLILVALLGIAGVGGVAGASIAGVAAAQEPPQKGSASPPVEVHLTEYAIAMPKTLPAGPTTFSLHNDGVKTHRFNIEGPGITEAVSKQVQPRQTVTLELNLQPGEYKVYCPIGSHAAKGMTLTLTVAAGTAAGGRG